MSETKQTAKHTPGPLEIIEQSIILDQQGKFVADLDPSDNTNPCVTVAEQIAYGRLFAASPDLLAACEFAMRYMRSLHADDQGAAEMAVMSDLSAAIAKAKGEA